MDEKSLFQRLKLLIIGAERDVADRTLFHKISLIALFAWVGLGSDGLSSTCYGPEEAFRALFAEGHIYLGVFVALATAITIFVISSSYRQIIELFPSGGGGYLVASKLLSPRVGMVSGCALLVDYVLTITISVASGTDAVLSFLPPQFAQYKLTLVVLGLLGLTVANLRGVKESVAPLIPVFAAFVVTHVFVIGYAMFTHASGFSGLVASTAADVRSARENLGLWGMLFLIMHSYGMGAGTYTGIEAVSNGLPILREPRVHTGKRTMTYMWISLAFVSTGLMLAYLLYNVHPEPGKTLNASLLERLTAGWHGGGTFVIITLLSESVLLFVAAQTGFLDGPRVLANMAADRWFPTWLSVLSDRLVTRNGILLMSGAAVITMVLARGQVGFLVVLYSINVFITFVLSQLGMVRHWWTARPREKGWQGKMCINGLGLALSLLILVWVTVSKFHEGGWITLVVTSSLVAVALLIRRHYEASSKMVRQLDQLISSAMREKLIPPAAPPKYDPAGRTAVLLVRGYNGMGIHSVLGIMRLFGGAFRNFVFIEVGVVDAGNFKGADEIQNLEKHVQEDVDKYVHYMRCHGFYAEGYSTVGADVVDEIEQLAMRVIEKHPQAVFFAGQLVFPRDSLTTRWLHNNITFSAQRRLYRQGISFVVLPTRLQPVAVGKMVSRM